MKRKISYILLPTNYISNILEILTVFLNFAMRVSSAFFPYNSVVKLSTFSSSVLALLNFLFPVASSSIPSINLPLSNAGGKGNKSK